MKTARKCWGCGTPEIGYSNKAQFIRDWCFECIRRVKTAAADRDRALENALRRAEESGELDRALRRAGLRRRPPTLAETLRVLFDAFLDWARGVRRDWVFIVVGLIVQAVAFVGIFTIIGWIAGL